MIALRYFLKSSIDRRTFRFIPRKFRDVQFVQKSHQDFDKYKDTRTISSSTHSSVAVERLILLSNPRRLDIIGENIKGKHKFGEVYNEEPPKPDTQGQPEREKAQDNELSTHRYGAFPMHARCLLRCDEPLHQSSKQQ